MDAAALLAEQREADAARDALVHPARDEVGHVLLLPSSAMRSSPPQPSSPASSHPARLLLRSTQ